MSESTVPHASVFVSNVNNYAFENECRRALKKLDDCSRSGVRTLRYSPRNAHNLPEIYEYMKGRFTPELGYRIRLVEMGSRVVGQHQGRPLHVSIYSIEISF